MLVFGEFCVRSKWMILYPEAYLKTSQTSYIEIFYENTAESHKLFSQKHPIIDIWQGTNCTSAVIFYVHTFLFPMINIIYDFLSFSFYLYFLVQELCLLISDISMLYNWLH